MTANNVLRKFFWCAFAVFLLASISHVAYFFHSFEPDGLYYWLVAYAIAVSIDVTLFLCSLTIAELRHRQVEGWLVASVWVFIVILAAFSWFTNWEYATQFASNALSKASSNGWVNWCNPILASCFQVLAIAYTWISDKIAQATVQSPEIADAISEISLTPTEISELQSKTPEIAPLQLIAQRNFTDDELKLYVANHPDMSGKDIALKFQVSPSKISRLRNRKENV